MSAAELLALAIAGTVLSPIINVFKSRFGLSGVSALWFAYGLSAVTAVFALLATGGLAALPDIGSPPDFVTFLIGQSGVVFALATIVYNSLNITITRV